MLEVFDLDRRKTAILQNAFSKIESAEINGVPTFQFSLPANDKKNYYCKPFHYVRLDGGQLYRIIAPAKSDEEVPIKTYNCEHVIATLIDDVIFGQTVIGNRGTYTADVIRYVLQQQTRKNWVLDHCDFNRQFEYCYENENLLAALFSIPNLFTEPYMWTFNTSTYPWRLSLVRIDPAAKPEFYIRAGRNLLTFAEEKAAREVCTKLYCLGYGEGVNQLTIAKVNGGSPFLLAPQEKINEYGLITRIFVDRRFEDAESLKERGKAILQELQDPTSAKTFTIADLYELTNDRIDKAEIGKIARFTEDGTTTFITAITKNHDIPGDMQITLATKAVDVAQTIADLADRQRIEQVYSQGATQIYAQSVQANATNSVAAKLNFYIPGEMRIVNAVKVKINLSAFRSYSKTTSGGGASTATSSAGGSTTVTSSAGGGTTVTSSSGGGTNSTSSSGGSTTVTSSGGGGGTVTSSSGGSTRTTSSSGGGSERTSGTSSVRSSSTALTIDHILTGSTALGYAMYDTTKSSFHTHRYMYAHKTNGNYGWHSHDIYKNLTHSHNIAHTHTVSIPSHTHTVSISSHSHSVSIPSHTHRVSIGSHTHTVRIPNHSHSVTINAHSHSIDIPNHTHTVSIPSHTHEIIQGIFTFGNPSAAGLYIDGEYRCEVERDTEMDITEYLTAKNTGKIARGAWHSVEVKPNDKAYITIDMMIQGFIQSRGGNTV